MAVDTEFSGFEELKEKYLQLFDKSKELEDKRNTIIAEMSQLHGKYTTGDMTSADMDRFKNIRIDFIELNCQIKNLESERCIITSQMKKFSAK